MSRRVKILREMAYPEHFDWEQFNTLETFDDRLVYCNQNLIHLGSGSSRVVYQIDEERVLKLAKNYKGIAQNEVEATIGADGYVNDIFAGVLTSHPKFHWIEMNLCKYVGYDTFEKLNGGIGIFAIKDGLRCIFEGAQNPPNWGDIKINPLFIGIVDYIQKYNIEMYYDIPVIYHWGTHPDGRLVLLDYGLDDFIYEKYYDPDTRVITSM